MTKLSDTQAMILRAAAQRPEHIALPLPESLRGGAAAKVVDAMIAKGFLEEVKADIRKGDLLLWRDKGDGYSTKLVATDAGLAESSWRCRCWGTVVPGWRSFAPLTTAKSN